jgi:hypothetical protein
MSTDREPAYRMGPTRPRDLVAVALVAALLGYLLVRIDYGSIPPLPRLAGAAAAALGIAEAIFGNGLRTRIQAGGRTDGTRGPTGGDGLRPPVPPLTAARAVMAAKATSLAGAAFGGLWLGLLAYVLPSSGMVLAARSDAATAAVGLSGSVVMIAGALYLEFCCRAPRDRDNDPLRRS